MANFDTNHFYQLVFGKKGSDNSGQSLDGTSLYNHGTGAVFMKNTNTTDSEEQWQIFPFNSSVYVLRTKASGSEGYLAAGFGKDEDTPGKTVPIMVSALQADASMFWQINPWGDGTFSMSNLANGSAWHLTVKSNSLMAMTSNISLQQDGQSFSFLELGTINDSSYNSVVTPFSKSTPSSTASSIGTTSTSSTSATSPTIQSATSSIPTSSSTQSAASKSGLSTGALAAIGASIGAVVLIAGVIIAFIIYKRRKRPVPDYTSASEGAWKGAPEGSSEETSESMAWQVAEMPPKDSYVRQDAREMEVPPSELHGHHEPVELPGYSTRS